MTTNTPTFLVVWKDDGPHMQSEVSIGICDPRQMTNREWVEEAALTEGYSKDDVEDLMGRGYELLLVCSFPKHFYDN